MHRLPLALALALPCAVAAAPPESLQPPPLPPRMGIDGRLAPETGQTGGCDEFVLVEGGSALYASPEVTPDRPLPTHLCHGNDPRPGAPGHYVMRVRGLQGDFVEVVSLGPSPDRRAHCTLREPEPDRHGSTRNRLEKYLLRLFVHRSRLMTVLRRDVRLEGPEGARVHLSAGLPVKPVEGGYASVLEETDLAYDTAPITQVPLPEDAVGLSYWPTTGRRDESWPPVDAQPVTPPDPMERFVTRDVAGARVGGVWTFLRTRERGTYRTWAVARSRCAHVRAPVRLARHREQGEPEVGVVGGVVGGVLGCSVQERFRPWEVDVGARVYWADGRRAGVALQADTFAGPARRTPSGRLCFDEVRLDAAPNLLTLCFDPEDVRPEGSMCPSEVPFSRPELYVDEVAPPPPVTR